LSLTPGLTLFSLERSWANAAERMNNAESAMIWFLKESANKLESDFIWVFCI
jgi:hypothetical protein